MGVSIPKQSQNSKTDLVLNSFAIFTGEKLSTKILGMDGQKVWNKILEQIKEQISAANFRTWFSQTQLKQLSGSKLTLAVPSAFVKGQLISRYDELIKTAGEGIVGQKLEINYLIDPSLASSKPSLELNQEEDIFQLSSSGSPTQSNMSLLSPRNNLANFVVGLTNNLAYAAAQAVVQNPGVSYNPLFIYGPSGVGKTHLMQGIGNALLVKNPYLKVIYASSERFMNDFVDSIQTKKTGDFRQKYRSCQVLLIDDIQFISGKDSTQEEFFHTFNELHSRSSQLVFTSDRPPNEIQRLEARLQSRFQGGLMVDIQLPDFDTRMAILKAKLQEREASLPEEALKLIAENTASNTRELEGKLIQILQMIKLNNQEATPEVIRNFLGKPQTTANVVLDHKKVLGGINQYFNLKMAQLTGPRRQKELVLPRQIAMYLMYEECKLPLERIGQILGGRDHTTIMHGVDKIKNAVARDREIQRLVIEIKQQLAI